MILWDVVRCTHNVVEVRVEVLTTHNLGVVEVQLPQRYELVEWIRVEAIDVRLLAIASKLCPRSLVTVVVGADSISVLILNLLVTLGEDVVTLLPATELHHAVHSTDVVTYLTHTCPVEAWNLVLVTYLVVRTPRIPTQLLRDKHCSHRRTTVHWVDRVTSVVARSEHKRLLDTSCIEHTVAVTTSVVLVVTLELLLQEDD